MTKHTTDYLIIGNSGAGIAAAEAIRSLDNSGSITIVSREPYASYGRPLISYMIEGKTSLDNMDYRPEDFYESRSINALLGSDYEAVALDAQSHSVSLAGGDTISYGKCLMATGSVAFVPPIKGLESKTNVLPFLTLDDAKAAWSTLIELQGASALNNYPLRVLIIGAGLIGLKAAEALSNHCDEVVVLELAPRILPTVLDNDGAALVQKSLLPHRIVCKPGVSADELIGDGDRVTSARLTNGEIIDCDLVITAVGVRPNSALAVSAGADCGRGLIIDEHFKTSLPDVYAAGDVIQIRDRLDGTTHPLALWPQATTQGRIAGLSMVQGDDAETLESAYAINAVDFFDLSLLTAGIINPSDDLGAEVRYRIGNETYAKFVILNDRLVGYILINCPDNAGLYTALIEEQIPLSSMDPAIFDRTPTAMDFPAQLRWDRFHAHYPVDRDKLGWRK